MKIYCSLCGEPITTNVVVHHEQEHTVVSRPQTLDEVKQEAAEIHNEAMAFSEELSRRLSRIEEKRARAIDEETA